MSCRAPSPSCLVCMLADLLACLPACLSILSPCPLIDQPVFTARTHASAAIRGLVWCVCFACAPSGNSIQHATTSKRQDGVAGRRFERLEKSPNTPCFRGPTLDHPPISRRSPHLSRQQRFAHFLLLALHLCETKMARRVLCWHTNLTRIPGGAQACSVALLPRPWCRRQGPPPKSLLLSGVYPPNLGYFLGRCRIWFAAARPPLSLRPTLPRCSACCRCQHPPHIRSGRVGISICARRVLPTRAGHSPKTFTDIAAKPAVAIDGRSTAVIFRLHVSQTR